MIIGTPKEIKPNETRVGLTPEWTKTLCNAGNIVLIQAGAGHKSDFEDEEYEKAGAQIVPTINDIYAQSEFIVKAKELQPKEYPLLKKGQTIMAWFHLAEDINSEMTQALLDAKITALSMELIVLENGIRPTIKPMSDIAGSLAMLEAVKYCEKINGGTGILLRQIEGIPTPKIVILGAGHAGFNAAQVALGLGLDVSVVKASSSNLTELKNQLNGAKFYIWSTDQEKIDSFIRQCDVLINCIYPKPAEKGHKEPLIKETTVKKMKRGSLIMDISGGGLIETTHYTTLGHPVYQKDGVRHYAVDNMPALCPKTSTQALLQASGPYILDIATKGLKRALRENKPLMRCVSTVNGKIVHPEIGENQGMPYVPFDLKML